MKNLLGLEALSIQAQSNIKGGGKYAPSEIPTTPTLPIVLFPVGRGTKLPK